MGNCMSKKQNIIDSLVFLKEMLMQDNIKVCDPCQFDIIRDPIEDGEENGYVRYKPGNEIDICIKLKLFDNN